MQIIALRTAELGEGFTVGRALPTRDRRMVGAWCFLDHIGPIEQRSGAGMHVGAHPHIGLQTFTWMMEGKVLHRDSLGSEQLLRPGQVNLMTAGRGVAHTEDSLEGGRLHAAQLWIALPAEHAEIAPAFDHYPGPPKWSNAGVELTLLVGEFDGREAPTRVYSPLMGLDLHAPEGGRVVLPLRPEFEYGLLPTTGILRVNDTDIATGSFAYLAPGEESLELAVPEGGRCLLVGGEPFGSTVSMWWNFVSTSRDDIDQAYRDWQAGIDRFPPVPHARERLDSPRPPWMRD